MIIPQLHTKHMCATERYWIIHDCPDTTHAHTAVRARGSAPPLYTYVYYEKDEGRGVEGSAGRERDGSTSTPAVGED